MNRRAGQAARLHPAPGSQIIARQRGDLVSPVLHERLLTDNLSTIRTMSSRIAWRGGLPAEEVDDFCSHVVEKLIDDNYEVLRRFEGRGSLPAYLAVVIQRLFQDYRNHLWGKWRPSVEARRRGPLAIRLERLIGRDGLTLDEAAATLAASGETVDRQELETLAQGLPVRVRRRVAGDDALTQMPDTAPGVDDRAAAERLRPGAERIRSVLNGAVAQLPDEDATLIRLCFWEQMSIAAVARAVGVPQKPLYRRIERVLHQLRQALVEARLDAEAQSLLDHLWSDLLEAPGSERRELVPIRAATSSGGSEVTGARG